MTKKLGEFLFPTNRSFTAKLCDKIIKLEEKYIWEKLKGES